MNLFASSHFGRAVTAAGVGAALMLSVATGLAQSGGPFAGFDGSWSGNGTVTLSNGSDRAHPLQGGLQGHTRPAWA